MRTTNEPWMRDRPTREQRRNDLAWGFALTVATLLAIALRRSAYPATDLGWAGVEAYLWGAGLALPLTVRRRFPLTVMLLSALSFYGMGQRLPSVSVTFMVQICFFMPFYTAWAWSRQRFRLTVVTTVVVVAMFAWVFWQLATHDVGQGTAGAYGILPQGVALAIATVAINLVYFFGAITWGLVSWRSARQRDELAVQADQLRREQETNAQRAVENERVRIARDLHDVVAHHVSGIGIQAAGAGRLLDRDPEQSRDALGVIERSSREAVSEMHQLVSLLRTGDASDAGREPRPGLVQIGQLAGGATNGTFRAAYREVGDPFAVPETIGVSLYRTAQEALTNVRRHSTADAAEIVLRYLDAPRAVEIEVLDDGAPRQSSSARAHHGGFGLQGIAERAQLHRAETEIGPRPDGGYRVRVRVPVEESA